MSTLTAAALLSVLPLSSAPPSESGEVEIYAYLEAEDLAVGGEYSFIVGVSLPDGARASDSGAPAPFLQIDVPPSVKLGGRYLKTYQELAQNEFLLEPYERLLEEPETPVLFELVSAPKAGEVIAFNILAYVRPGGGKDDYFLRRRFELPLTPGAEAMAVSAAKSDWGPDEKLLQIGDQAAPFELPDAGGAPVSLGDYLGESNVIVTTYRAHW